MLTSEENDILTRVGPGTPLGELFRRYWIPALLSDEIPAPDCPPVRVKLLGEDLVAFRDSRGKVGLLDEYCSHRRASLFYGRNEECGLRCIYHGWKYDTEGNVLETPAEPAASNLKHKVYHPAYPCKEAAGVVFTYMGPKQKMPLFSDYEWLTASPNHVVVAKFSLECNYLQALEGDCDPAHLPFLHLGKLDPENNIDLSHQRVIPTSYDIEETRIGLRVVVGRRDAENERVSNFIMPFIGCVPVGLRSNGILDGFLVIYQTPSDDYRTTRYNFRFKRSQPLSDYELNWDKSQIGPGHILKANKHNDYLIDREKQRTSDYTGIPGFRAQDACVTESMGPICDRTKEHLGFSDTYVIGLRRFLLKAARDLQEGKEAPGINTDATEVDLNCTDVMMPSNVSGQ